MQVIAQGRFVTVAPALADGEVRDLRLAADGTLMTSGTAIVTGTVALSPTVALADDMNPGAIYPVGSFLMAFDGATWDRLRVRNMTSGVATPGVALDVADFGMAWDIDASLWRFASGDANGARLITTRRPPIGSAPTYTRTTVFAGSGAIKSSAAQLCSCIASTTGTRIWWQLFNKTTAPAAGDVPIYSIGAEPGLPARLNLSDVGFQGSAFGTGLSFGWSSTAELFTAAAPALGTVSATVHYA